MADRKQLNSPEKHNSRTRLLDAALDLIRAKGYSATAVDEICHRAGVTKGSFFHHFRSKDDLALAAVAHWEAKTASLFAAAPYHRAQDPLDRLLGYVDFRAANLTGELAEYTCLLGTLVQETYATHPEIRAACERALSAHIAELTRDVEAARQLYAPDASWSAESVGNFIQAVLQGSFILAKAKQGPEVVRENLEHLRRTLRVLFQPDAHSRAKEERAPPAGPSSQASGGAGGRTRSGGGVRQPAKPLRRLRPRPHSAMRLLHAPLKRSAEVLLRQSFARGFEYLLDLSGAVGGADEGGLELAGRQPDSGGEHSPVEAGKGGGVGCAGRGKVRHWAGGEEPGEHRAHAVGGQRNSGLARQLCDSLRNLPGRAFELRIDFGPRAR